MLEITTTEDEFFDQTTNRFIPIPACTLTLEHSLISLAKWESKWCIPYLGEGNKTEIQELDGFILKLPPTIDPNQAKLDEITRTNKQRSLWGIISFALVLFYFFGGFSDKYALLEN